MTLCDDADLRVKFVCETGADKTKHTTYQSITQFIKDGIELAEDVERFKVVIKAEFRKNNVKYASADETPFFVILYCAIKQQK